MKEATFSVFITSQPNYIQEQSDPSHHKYIWSYEIAIRNDCEEIIQLLTRYWRITDLTGKVEEVHGTGVIGLQPIIKPGKEFVYVSYCQLPTPQGTMEGHYGMQNLNEKHFSVKIPKFILSAPSAITTTFRSKLH